MIPWKQRLYAFLLRRVLSPFLDDTSTRQLHDLMDVSLQEGSFVLKDVSLNAAYLTGKINGKDGPSVVVIRKATIARLEIQLTLRDNNNNNDSSSTTRRHRSPIHDDDHSSESTAGASSFAWRALQFGGAAVGSTTTNLPAVSLLAEIHLDGIELELEPTSCSSSDGRGSASQRPSPPLHATTQQGDDASSPKGILGAYVEAALASLQLSLKLTNVHIKAHHGPEQRMPTSLESQVQPQSSCSKTWVSFRLSSLLYKDLVPSRSNNAPSERLPSEVSSLSSAPTTTICKSLEISEFKIQTGDESEPVTTSATTVTPSAPSQTSNNLPISSSHTIAMAQGSGRLFWKIHKRKRTPSNNTPTTNKGETQQDVEIDLNHQLNFSVGITSLLQVQRVVSAFAAPKENLGKERHRGDPDAEVAEYHNSSTTAMSSVPHSTLADNPHLAGDTDTDQEDLKALTGIMKQYREAYHLAEKNQLRGGILVPSNAYEDCDEDHSGSQECDDETFDAFFDANDQSIYNATSVLAESVRLVREDASETTAPTASRMSLKINLRVRSACLKVLFQNVDPKTHQHQQDVYRSEEYVLVTMDDLNLSIASTKDHVEVNAHLSLFQIEDAQQEESSSTEEALYGSKLDIGTLFGFVCDDADAVDDMIVAQAPCIALSYRRSKNVEEMKSRLDCDLTIQPVEMMLRQRTLSNITCLVSAVQQTRRHVPDKADSSRKLEDLQTIERELFFHCICQSVEISTPLMESVPTSRLFNRYGQAIQQASMAKPSVGILIEGICIDWNRKIVEEGEGSYLDEEAKMSFHHLLAFAVAPKGDELRVDSTMQRVDLFLANGRMAVNPYTPISFEYKKNNKSQKNNMGRSTFPLVPSISSFKARQEDEDDEMEIDRLLFSKLSDVEADSRSNLRCVDPQFAMVAESERCDFVLVFSIPEIHVDYTTSEVELLHNAFQAIQQQRTRSSDRAPIPTVQRVPSNSSQSKSICIVCRVDEVSISLKEDFGVDARCSGSEKSRDTFSALFVMDKLQSHVLLRDSSLRHVRFLAHEPCFYTAHHPRSDIEMDRGEQDGTTRVKNFQQRVKMYRQAKTAPRFYRSHLFTPISQGTPSLLIDFIDASVKSFTQRQLHLTLYHLTARYDADSEWLRRISTLLPVLNTTPKSTVPKEPTPVPSMTRMFISLADVSVDFCTPDYFESVSRSVLRIGDLRISSNLVEPQGLVQAYTASLGDLSYHICNKRLPYGTEDQKLCRWSSVSNSAIPVRARPKSHVTGSAAEALLRDMGFIETLSLDSMDAILATSYNRRNTTSDPKVRFSLTFGLLALNACKDSFSCFSETLGELGAKLTSLSEQEIAELSSKISMEDRKKEMPIVHPKIVVDGVSSQLPDGLTLSSTSFSNGPLPEIPVRSVKLQPAFLLDGYEWTTIDHDHLPEPTIPDGEEQVAGWYEAAPTVQNSSNFPSGLPLQMIHQHFPLRSMNDPLSDGDMDASTLAGEGAKLVLKSRLLVHKLTVQVRLYDGFDWPSDLSQDDIDSLQKRGSFVIEPIPEDEVSAGKAPTDDGFENVGGDMETKAASQQRKTKLMADLLGESDNTKSSSMTFQAVPLPIERAVTIQRQEEIRRLSRKTHIYFQVSANAITARMDGYEPSDTHRLTSVLSLNISEFFLAETASQRTPVKMLGEWINLNQHPSDSRDGTLMIKMATWSPLSKVNQNGDLESDDCEVTLQFLPMRCIIDQRVIAFVRSFFYKKEPSLATREKWSDGLHLVPPPRFQAFRVNQWKLKVDYMPQKLNIAALREGSLVELVNLSPIDGMVITLSEVSVEGVVGMGPVGSGLVSSWVKEVCATQLHKFLANARPFEPLTDVGQGLTDLVVLPYEAFKNGDGVKRAMKSGIKSLAQTVAFQTLTTTSRLTEYAAKKMAGTVGGSRRHVGGGSGNGGNTTSISNHHSGRSSSSSSGAMAGGNPLPSRPAAAPKGVQDVTHHAMESLARGIQAANYKVVVVPFREYTRSGASGAMTSVVRGIPVLLVAPLTGATEALSYTLLGARNALRPDIRKEEEASRSGFNQYNM